MNYKVDETYKVVLQISCNGYDHKPTESEIKRMCWSDTVVPLFDLVYYIRQGYTFTPFDRDKGKCGNKYSNVLFLDYDSQAATMDECLSVIKYKPTIAYQTFNDGIVNPKKKVEAGYNRFRLIYVFDKEYNGLQFLSLRNHILANINYNGELDDKVVNQYYNGTSVDKKLVCTNLIYELPDNLKEETPEVKTIQPKEEYKDLFSDDVWNNYWSMPLNDFKNWCFSEFGTELPLETPYTQKNDERILELPDNYLRLPVKYRWDKDLKTNIRVQWCDGENRNLKLWNCCMVLLRMQSLTADELLYHLVDFFLNYINNSDGKYGKIDLIEKVVKSLNADISHSLNSGKYPAYRVDPLYCALHKVSKREVANKVNAEKHTAKKLERYKQIQQWYDPAKTDKENLVILSEHNIDISRDTLLRFKKWLKSNV